MVAFPEIGQALLSLLPQKRCHSITLKDLHRLHLLSPLESKGPPGLELNYGSAESPQTIWFELPKVSGRGLSRQIPWQGRRGLTPGLACPEPGPMLMPGARVWCGPGQTGEPCPHMPVPRAGPGAEGHHRLPAGQQPSSQLVAGLTQEEWGRGGDEEGAPPRSKSDREGLPWVLSGHFGLDFPMWLFWNLPQHSTAGPHGGHKAGAATVTSTEMASSRTPPGGPGVGAAGTCLGI